MKRRLSTLLSYSTNALPSLAEIHKQELETEITNVEKVLDQEYTSIPRSISRENHSHFVEEKGLKANLNRLVSENKGKEAKIAGLIDLINCYSFMSRKAGPVSTQNFHSDYEIDDLREQLFNEAENIKEEENYTEVLIETKRKIIESTLCWKEKLGALSKVQGEIDRKYSEVLYSKQKAAFNLHAVQSEIAHLKKFQQKSQKKFRNAVEKGKMVKETHTNEVREKIEKISRNNLKSRESRSQRVFFLKNLETRLSTNQMKSTQNRISLKELVIIEKRLNEIKQLIPECKGFSQPLCKEDISLIINTFGKLKFQEHSLSVRFQNLTGEQLEKQNECDLIREELLKLKEENEGAFLQNNVGKVNTQLNSEIKLEKSSLKTQDLQENQRLLLQLYLQALNLAMVLCRAVNVINANSVYHQNDNSFANNLNLVKKAQQGFITRKKKELKTAFSSSKKMFRTELDNLEEIMSFSINLNDIKEILSRHIPESKVLDEVSVLIKADIITCFFLDIPELEVQIANIVNKKNVILDLNRIGNSVFQEKYSAISISAKEISTQINYLLGQCQDEMVRFYSNCTPYLRDLIHKSLPHELNPNTSTKDLNIKMPPKNIKRLSEESTSKYKVLDPNTKNTDEALKKRQEAPPQSKSFTKSSPQEIMTELNYLRIKMSELRRIERKVDAKPQKEYSKETKMGWARSLPQSSKHSSRPATVNFY